MALEFLNDAYFAAKVGIGTETFSTKLTISGQQELLQLTQPQLTNFLSPP